MANGESKRDALEKLMNMTGDNLFLVIGYTDKTSVSLLIYCIFPQAKRANETNQLDSIPRG